MDVDVIESTNLATRRLGLPGLALLVAPTVVDDMDTVKS